MITGLPPQFSNPAVILWRAFGHVASREYTESHWPLTLRELSETSQIIEFCNKLLLMEQ